LRKPTAAKGVLVRQERASGSDALLASWGLPPQRIIRRRHVDDFKAPAIALAESAVSAKAA
jgi:hypothetical protein